MAVFDPAIEPAFADEDVAKPRRERAQPRRAEPRRVEQRQATQTSNWNGGQLGGSNGGSSVNNVFVEPGAYVCPGFFPGVVSCFENFLSFSDRPLVYTVGAFAGYRWQFGTLVAGIEADASWKEAESTSSFARRDCFDAFCDIYRVDVKHGSITQGWDASVRGRFGVLVTPWTLLYATAGVAFGEIKGSFSYSGVIFVSDCCGGSDPTSFARASGSWSDIRVGGTIGAGAETEIFPGVKARLEYRYADFGTYTKNLPVTTFCDPVVSCTNPSSNVRIDLSPSFHTFRIGLGIDL